MHSKSTYLPTLDGWRALAISMVILSHSVPFITTSHFLSLLLELGQKGVTLFFAISGLLICTRLLQEQDRSSQISLRSFYIRRAFRILPPALTYLVALLALGRLGFIPGYADGILGSAFFFRNYLPSLLWPATRGWYTAHYWSLSVEEHFYLVWPTLLIAFGWRSLRWVAFAVALASAGLRFLDRNPLHGHFQTQFRVDAIMCGCLMALLLQDNNFYRWLMNLGIAFWVAVTVLYVCIVTLTRQPLLIESAVIPFLLAGTILHPNSRPSRLLESPVLRWVGRLSYSLYIWQELFLTHLSPTLGIFQRWPVNLAAVFTCACASYYIIERPMIAIGHRLATQNSKQILSVSTSTGEVGS